MTTKTMKILVVGATGSIGRLVVEEATKANHVVRALIRSSTKATFPKEVETVTGDVTHPHSLAAAVDGVDAIVFTLGSEGLGKAGAENVDYGGVRNTLFALNGRRVRIALMTSIGVTNRNSSYNRSTEAHDWKRRSERLLRASGLPYTIVRPGWFDYNAPDQDHIVFLQGDKRHAGDPSDGAISRRQIAQVLVRSLTSPAAARKTLELVAEDGPPQEDLEPLFVALEADPHNAVDAALDTANMPLEREPARVVQDIERAREIRPSA